MDPVEQAKSGMGSLERLIAKLPGIRGYKDKEMRRSADKQVRDNLVRELELRRNKITGMQEELLSAGGLLWLDDAERVVGRLQLLMDRVRTAAYGYGGFFDMQKVREAELDKLAQFDQALFEVLPKLDDAVAALEKAIQANDGIKEALQVIGDLVAQTNDTFGKRMQAIQGA